MKAKEEKFLSRGWVGTEPEFDPPDEVSTRMVNTLACRHAVWMTRRMRATSNWNVVVCRYERRGLRGYHPAVRLQCPLFPLLHPSTQWPPERIKTFLEEVLLR